MENQALYEKIQTLNAKITILITENHNLKEGQKKAIEEAKKDKREPELFFKEEEKTASREMQIDQITFKTIQASAKALDGEALAAELKLDDDDG